MVVAVAVLQRFELGAPWDGPLGHRHRLALAGQRGGQAIPIDQHQLGLAEVAALLRCQPELVGVVTRLQQAAHPQIVCGQALGDVAEHAIAGDHLGRWGGSAAGKGQG